MVFIVFRRKQCLISYICKIILNLINVCIFYEEQICVLNHILMLDHALTKYDISICFVNVLMRFTAFGDEIEV